MGREPGLDPKPFIAVAAEVFQKYGIKRGDADTSVSKQEKASTRGQRRRVDHEGATGNHGTLLR